MMDNEDMLVAGVIISEKHVPATGDLDCVVSSKVEKPTVSRLVIEAFGVQAVSGLDLASSTSVRPPNVVFAFRVSHGRLCGIPLISELTTFSAC